MSTVFGPLDSCFESGNLKIRFPFSLFSPSPSLHSPFLSIPSTSLHLPSLLSLQVLYPPKIFVAVQLKAVQTIFTGTDKDCTGN